MNVQDLAEMAALQIKSADGPLKDFKALHQEMLLDVGFATPPEAYKFTNLTRFFEGLTTETARHSIPEVEDGAFVFVDGKLIQSPSIEGVTSGPLGPDDLKKVLSNNAPLSHLHHGLMGPGLLIEVGKNIELRSPLKVLHILGLDEVAAPTVVIRLSANAKATLIEETRASKASYAQVAESYVELATGSQLEHLHLDRGETSSLHHGSTWAQVQQDASYRNFIFHTSGKLNRRNLDLKLQSSGANGESYALFLTNGEEHSDISTVINHLAPDTTSNQIAKGILSGDSKGVFTGKIHIHPKAQRVASGQINRNLLLSQKAHVHSQPQLEIFADDVKCSHGSTTGQMSPDELFYFEARGIPAERARTLLAFGFGLEVVQKIQDPDARKQVETLVMNALHEKFQLGGAS
jgi:Fe-S cluster assembly protein SufD